MSAQPRPCRVESDAKPSAVTEALRRHFDRYRERHGLDPARMRVVRRLLACRTGALGVHLRVCDACGYKAPAYNSCRDRHCPQCQGRAAALWLDARRARMLPVPHFQVVFTLPAALRSVAFANQRLVYTLLMRTAASVLHDLAAQRLDATLGVTTVLHTWASDVSYHPHVHCLVTAGGLHTDGERWVPTRDDFLFPQAVMGAMFRGRFLDGLIDAFERGDLCLPGPPDRADAAFRDLTSALARRLSRWVVHVEPPRGRSHDAATKYLARYVKRVAISDSRILRVTDTHVTIASRAAVPSLDGAEFVRRFLLHVLPRGFNKIRHTGLYAPGRASARLEHARSLLPPPTPQNTPPAEPAADLDDADVAPAPPTLERCPACRARSLRRVFPTRTEPPRHRGPP